jgi:hypothetical protein
LIENELESKATYIAKMESSVGAMTEVGVRTGAGLAIVGLLQLLASLWQL